MSIMHGKANNLLITHYYIVINITTHDVLLLNMLLYPFIQLCGSKIIDRMLLLCVLFFEVL